MSEKARRAKELEEKRKKLEEMKKNRSKPSETEVESPSSAASSASSKQFLDLEKITDLNSLLDKLAPLAPTGPGSPGSPGAEKEEKKDSKVEGGEKTFRRKLPTLSISPYFELDLPPRMPEMYSRTTQTISLSTEKEGEGKEEEEDKSQPVKELPKEEREEKSEVPSAASAASSATSTETPKTVSVVRELSQEEKDSILKDTEFLTFLDRSARVIERSLKLHQMYDVTKDYADTSDQREGNASAREMRMVNKYFDERWCKHRGITDVALSPTHSDLVACAYSSNENSGSNDADGLVLLWALGNPLNRPEYKFTSQSAVMSVSFVEYSPTLVVGGTYSGQVVLWDLRARSSPVQYTPLSSSGHTHPIYSLDVVGSRNAHNIVSISTDGKMCLWNPKNLLQPQEVLELVNKQSKSVTTSAAPVAVTCLTFPQGEVNEFFVGSEEGAAYEGFRHGSKNGIAERYEGHYGPITSLSIHAPSTAGSGSVNFGDYFLSSSTDWTAKLE